MRSMILVFLLGTACSSGIRSDAAGMVGAVAGEVSATSQEDRTNTCSEAVLRAEPLLEGFSLSVFRRFNPYPPEAPAKGPDGISLRASSSTQQDLLDCVPEGAFDFDVLEAGMLRGGSVRDLHPIDIFRVEGGNFIALYLHKDYETTDGEGVTIEASGLLMDSTGRVIDATQGLSSWYEYEGSIRIRDFIYAEGTVVTSEEVYDPSVVDSVGNPLKYSGGGARVIKTYDQVSGAGGN